MAYCRCFLVCFFVTLSYAWPTVKKIAADDDNTRGKILEWSHLIDKRSTEEADADDEGNSLDRSIAETPENSGHQEDNLGSPASAAASNDFDWKLLQSSNKRLADEIHRRRRRSSHFSKVAQKRLLRSKRAPPPQFTQPVRGAGLIGDETSPVERWGSEQNIAFDGDEIVAQAPPAALTNNQVQLTENDLKKLANLIETMQHLNEEGYGVDGRPISPQRDAPYTSNIEWDENPEIEEEMDENTLRQLLAAYHKMRAENVAQNELKNGRWINYPRNYQKRNLIKRSYDGPLTNYYGYDVLDDADLSTIRRGPIRIRIPPEYIDVVDDGNPKQGYEFAAPGRNLILIDTASLNGYLPTDGGNDEFLLSGRKGPVSVDPDRLQSEMALEKKIFDLANQVRAKRRQRR